MKVAIGSKYNGPALDRPCLRQMPREWTLTTERKKAPAWWTRGDRAVVIGCALIGAVAVGETLWRLFA